MAENPNSATRIAEQIERDSDYYSPEVYARLQSFSSLETLPDSLSFEFLPMSPARPNVKPFVVGLLPPPVAITGRLLDRSASLASLTGAATETVYLDNPAPRGDGLNAKTAVPDGATSTSSRDFWDRFVVMSNRLKLQPDQLAKVINFESGFKPDASNPSGAKGLNQLMPDQARNLFFQANGINAKTPGAEERFQEFWAGYGNLSKEEQLVWVERYFKSVKLPPGATAGQIQARNLGDAYTKLNGNGALYDGNARSKGYPNPSYQEKAYQQNKRLDRDNKGYISYDDIEKEVGSKPLPTSIQNDIDAARRRMGSSTTGPSTIIREPVPSNNPSWQGTGSINAQSAGRETKKLANTGLNASTSLGKRFLEEQLRTVRATQQAIDDIKNTPPLKMLINPTAFTVSDEKVISDGNWTRNGPIVEHWGPGQGKIEASGQLGAFYSMDLHRWEMPGLSRTARQYSTSYQNFLSLYLLYRNNGGVYLVGQDHLDPQRARLSLVGSVYIYFDGVLYLGSFDDFTITETEGKPFSLEYRYTFTIRARFRLDRPDTFSEAQNSRFNPGLQTKNGPALSNYSAPANEELRSSAERIGRGNT